MKVSVRFVNITDSVEIALRGFAQNLYPAYVRFITDKSALDDRDALLIVGKADHANYGNPAVEYLDPEGMHLDELLYHFSAKVGKLSRSDAITAKVDLIEKGKLSRREFLTGVKFGFQGFSAFPLILDGLCEAKYGCRKCIESCPQKALEFNGQLALDSSKCIKCGLCAGVCPVGAVQMPTLSDDAFAGLLEGLNAVQAPYRVLVLTTNEKKVQRVPWAHVEHIDDIGMVGAKWVSMALASGIDAFIVHCPEGNCTGKDKLKIIMETLNSSKKNVGKAIFVESEEIKDLKINKGAMPQVSSFSRFDSWFNYTASLKSLLNSGSSARGLQLYNLEVSDSCTLCGACASKCPHNALKINLEDSSTLSFNQSLCTGCGYCVSICPEGSINLSNAEKVKFEAVNVFKDKIIRCARCNKPLYTRKFYDGLIMKLGYEDPMLRFCNECKQRIIYERLFKIKKQNGGSE